MTNRFKKQAEQVELKTETVQGVASLLDTAQTDPLETLTIKIPKSMKKKMKLVSLETGESIAEMTRKFYASRITEFEK